MHVEVDQAHLGFGDLRDRLTVHARELQEGDRRQARLEHRRDVAQHFQVLVGEQLRRAPAESHRGEEAFDQPLLEPGLARDFAHRVAAFGAAQQILDRPDRELAVVARSLDLRERVTACAQASDDAYVGRRSRRPAPGVTGNEADPDPPFDRAGRDAGARRDLCERGLGGRRDHRLCRLSHANAGRRAFPCAAV